MWMRIGLTTVPQHRRARGAAVSLFLKCTEHATGVLPEKVIVADFMPSSFHRTTAHAHGGVTAASYGFAAEAHLRTGDRFPLRAGDCSPAKGRCPPTAKR